MYLFFSSFFLNEAEYTESAELGLSFKHSFSQVILELLTSVFDSINESASIRLGHSENLALDCRDGVDGEGVDLQKFVRMLLGAGTIADG